MVAAVPTVGRSDSSQGIAEHGLERPLPWSDASHGTEKYFFPPADFDAPETRVQGF